MSVRRAFFIIGPSGVGKTAVARYLVEGGFHHIDIDQHFGFNANGLRRQWHQFSEQRDIGPLCEALQRRASEANAHGLFLSLPSTRVLDRNQVEIAARANIKAILLWAPLEFCKSARRARDEAQGSIFDAYRYQRSNAKAFKTYGAPEFDDIRLAVRDASGEYRDAAAIAEEIIRRISD